MSSSVHIGIAFQRLGERKGTHIERKKVTEGDFAGDNGDKETRRKGTQVFFGW